MWPMGDIVRYGNYVPQQYGGCLTEDDLLIVLFTANLPVHEQALTALLGGLPDNLRLRQAVRAWQEVERVNSEVQRRLMSGVSDPRVNSVGIGVEDGQFVISVGIAPYNAGVIAEVKAAAAPHEIAVRASGPATRF
jgi:hypothetical protein